LLSCIAPTTPSTHTLSLHDALPISWPDNRFVLAVLVIAAALAFGTFFTPGMTLVSNLAEERGLRFGWSFALLNIAWAPGQMLGRSEEHTSELQSRFDLVCRLLLEKK